MLRTIPWMLAATTALLLSLVELQEAHSQQSASVELNQSLLDRWLVAMPRVVKLGKSSTAPQTDEQARPHIESICAEAGFDNYDQCAAVIAYVGMIVTGCDWRTRTFLDPIVTMRRQIARIEADAKLSPADKDNATAELKQIVAGFPNNLPEAHLRLMNANRDRIFAALAQSAQ